METLLKSVFEWLINFFGTPLSQLSFGWIALYLLIITQSINGNIYRGLKSSFSLQQIGFDLIIAELKTINEALDRTYERLVESSRELESISNKINTLMPRDEDRYESDEW